MTAARPSPAARNLRRPVSALAGLMVLQSVATVYFVGDAVADVADEPGTLQAAVETLIAVALVAGLVLTGVVLRRMLTQIGRQETALAVATGALMEVIDRQFTLWGLTPAERDVGLMAIKGLDLAEIAALRGAAQGTVRAQLTRIYAKAGVSGRAQFAAWFVEDLMGEGIVRS